MKILNLEQFRKLPENTLFSKYEPCVFQNLEIKGETWECDFLTQEIASAVECDSSGDFCDRLEEAKMSGDSIPIDLDCEGRDGCFDNDQLFAVWEKDDVAKLIERLSLCISNDQVEFQEGSAAE